MPPALTRLHLLMAPCKPQLPTNQKITSFFSSFAAPKERRQDPGSLPHENLVTSEGSDPHRPAHSRHANTKAQKRKRRGEDAADGVVQSSSGKNGSCPKRGRGRPPEQPGPAVASNNTNEEEDAVMQRFHSKDHGIVANEAAHGATATLAPSPVPSSSVPTPSAEPKSSAPATSAIGSSTSSRRIMKDGLKAIANSDSDPSDDSSDGGLAEPGSFFAKRRKISPEPSKSVVAPRGTRLSDTSRWEESSLSMPKSPPRTVYKHSLASLHREGQKMREAEACIARMKQAVEASKQREQEAERRAAMGIDVDGDAAALLEWASDDEEGERRLKALQRVEALHATDDFHYFLDSEPLFPDAPFPVEALPDEPWSSLWATDMSREQACISGFAAEMVVHFPLPMAITNWLAQQLLHEQNETLCEAYVDILRASSAHPECLSDTLASLSSMYKTRSLFEHNWKDPVRRGLPLGLKHILSVVQFCAPASDSVVPDAEPLKTIEAFLDLAMMSLDAHVRRDVHLSLTLAKCSEKLLDSLTEDAFKKLVSGILVMLDETEANLTLRLRCCLTASLPSRTARSYHLRRRIALETFITAQDRAKVEEVGWNWLESIHKSLQSRDEFDVKDSTDFNLLLPMIEVMDIAVSAGFTDYNELHTMQIEHDKIPSNMFARPPPLAQAARSHNDVLDAIVAELQYIKSKIQHEATHLRRQEVKAALDRYIARIETSVRTRAKPKKNVFGNAPKQARFDKARLMTVEKPMTMISGEQYTMEDPVTPPAEDDLPIRPDIDMIKTPDPQRDRSKPTPEPAHEVEKLKEEAVNGAELEESSSDDFHTAYEMSQPRV